SPWRRRPRLFLRSPVLLVAFDSPDASAAVLHAHRWSTRRALRHPPGPGYSNVAGFLSKYQDPLQPHGWTSHPSASLVIGEPPRFETLGDTPGSHLAPPCGQSLKHSVICPPKRV